MKKLFYFMIILGIACLGGIVAIAAYSVKLSDFVKNAGFIILGYIGVISFTYGWMKLHKK